MSSIIKVDTIQLADGTAGTIENLGLATGALSHRNLIINGAMQVAQRGTSSTGVTGTTAAYRTCDRFLHGIRDIGTWTVEQSTDSPNGFSSSLKVTCTTSTGATANNSYTLIRQWVEAQNLEHLAYGTSDAKALTLSFWVKSNLTGDASINVRQEQNSERLVSPTYTINSADTWEYKTISIPADTSGIINNGNDVGQGLDVAFWMNSGTDYTGGTSQTSWTSQASADRNAANLGVGDTVNDYFAITGVQLEVGSVATPFEHRSYGEELARCERYYQKSDSARMTMWSGNTTSGQNYFHGISFITQMRTTPSMTATAGGSIAYFSGVTAANPDREGFWVGGTCDTSGNAGYWSCTWTADAEL